jgi:CBS-domain-containing membrane protein
MKRITPFVAALLEAALILVVSVAGWLAHKPLVFASLGPTAFEIIETPNRPSARLYNILVGNLVAVFAAHFALWITDAWAAAAVSASGVPAERVYAATLAAFSTVLLTLLLKATQPAALSTTLLISLGVMQTWKDAALVMAAVTFMSVIGLPIRHWRKETNLAQGSSEGDVRAGNAAISR